jgi:dolichol-phosphate mannosyltransferase
VHGQSKMSLGIVAEAMFKVTGWGISSRLRRRRQPTSSDGSATRRSRA